MTTASGDEFWDIERLMKELGIDNRQVVYRWFVESSDRPPMYRIGQRRVFKRSDVQAWLKRRKEEEDLCGSFT